MSSINRKNFTWIGLILILTISGVSNYHWLRSDNTPFSGCDSNVHLYNSLIFFYRLSDIVSNPSFTFWSKIREIFNLMIMHPKDFHETWSFGWPYFTYLTSSIFNLFLGNSLFVTRLSMTLWFFILIVSTYFLGKEIADPLTGLLSAFIVSIYPPLFVNSRLYGLDFPLTSIVTLSMLFLILCKNFSERKYSLFLGICAGIGMLIKLQYLLFLILPLTIVLLKMFSENHRKNRVLNFSFFLLLSISISSLWWGNKIPHLFEELIFIHSTSPPSEEILMEHWEHPLLWYILRTAGSAGIFLFVLFIISTVFFVLSKTKYKQIILSWILSPYLIFPLVTPDRWSRYLLPVFPAMGLISSWGMSKISIPKYKISVLSVVVIFGLLQFISISFNQTQSLPVFKKLKEDVVLEARTDCRMVDRKIKELVEIFLRNNPHKNNIKVGIISISTIDIPSNLLYLLRLQERRILPISLHWWTNRFLCELPSMEFILFVCPQTHGLKWPDTIKKCRNRFVLVDSLSYKEKEEDYEEWYRYFVYQNLTTRKDKENLKSTP